MFLAGACALARMPHAADSLLSPCVAASELVALFREAVASHQMAYKHAMAGAGLDRHLFGLYVVAVGKNVEVPFLKNALAEPWRLSTSQQPQQQTTAWDPRVDADMCSPGGGFGPVSDDGCACRSVFGPAVCPPH